MSNQPPRDFFGAPVMTLCQRCGAPCRPGVGSETARLLRRAQHGVCIDCAVTSFVKDTPTLHALLAQRGVEILRDPRVQEQFGRIMLSGLADASADEINWDRVVDDWNLP